MGKQTIEELEAQVKQLAAENVSLKKFALELYFPDGTSRVQEEDIPCADSTDAILTSLRAEGVDTVVKYHKERSDALKEVDRQGSFYHSRAALDASDVAAQIRSQSEQVKGVQS